MAWRRVGAHPRQHLGPTPFVAPVAHTPRPLRCHAPAAVAPSRRGGVLVVRASSGEHSNCRRGRTSPLPLPLPSGGRGASATAAGMAKVSSAGMASVAAAAVASRAPSFQFQLPTLNGPLGGGQLMGVQTDDISIGGHRGMGENIFKRGKMTPSVRENTVASFLRAAKAGAKFVEFDVQVTKDGVPVIWHDNAMLYGNTSCPTVCKVADLTLAEFKALGLFSATGTCTQLSVVRNFRTVSGDEVGHDSSAHHGRHQCAWKCPEDDVFPTLEELFKCLPVDVAFNIEVKMATPEVEARTQPEEVARMVVPILRVISELSPSQQRTVVFSSFDPEVCIALRARQDAYPVMFLSTGGSWQHVDPRRMSIEAALGVAKAYNLSGVVLDTAALMREPHMVQQARKLGLRVLTYGVENCDAEWIRMQRMLGVHAAIVDDVEAVVSSLRLNREMALV